MADICGELGKPSHAPSPRSLHGALPPLFSPTSSRSPQKHPQGPPAPHRGLRMCLLGCNLWWVRENHLNICLARLKCSFSSSGEAHAPSHHLPELVCTFLSSAPAANPIVLPPTKSLLFVSLAGGIWLSQTPPERGPRLQGLLCCVGFVVLLAFFLPGKILNDHF